MNCPKCGYQLYDGSGRKVYYRGVYAPGEPCDMCGFVDDRFGSKARSAEDARRRAMLAAAAEQAEQDRLSGGYSAKLTRASLLRVRSPPWTRLSRKETPPSSAPWGSGRERRA